MNVISWMATKRGDGRWNSKELRILKEAARAARGDTFTKTGVREMAALYTNPAARFVGRAKDDLFNILVNEMGVDPAMLTGADKTDSFRDFEGLSRRGKEAFLVEAYSSPDFEIGSLEADHVHPAPVRARIEKKIKQANEQFAAWYQDITGISEADYNHAGALEDDYAGQSLETIQKNGELYGFVFTFTHSQGEMGDAFFMDHHGRVVGERDAGI